MKRKRFIKENVDEKELLKFQQEKTTIEDKARETVDPVYADAIRRGIRANKLKEKTLKVEETPKREENPKLPKMRNGAKQMKLTLDESLFREVEEEIKENLKEELYRDIEGIEYIKDNHGSWIKYKDEEFMYFGIEGKLWREFLKDNPEYKNSKYEDVEKTEEFNKYVKENIFKVLDEIIAKRRTDKNSEVDTNMPIIITKDGKKYNLIKTDEYEGVYKVKRNGIQTTIDVSDVDWVKTREYKKKINEAYKEQADESEAEELVLYIRNDNELYDRNIKPTATNLARKLNRGVFDKELAEKAFKYVVDAGVRKYKKEFPVEDGYEQYEFNLATREYAAKELLEDEMELIEDIADNLKKKDNKVEENLSGTMTAEEIAKKHKVPVEEINKQVEKGIKVEKEHTDDEKKAERIALDHLFEIPDYYDRLHKMEKDARVNEKLEDKKDYGWEVYALDNSDNTIKNLKKFSKKTNEKAKEDAEQFANELKEKGYKEISVVRYGQEPFIPQEMDKYINSYFKKFKKMPKKYEWRAMLGDTDLIKIDGKLYMFNIESGELVKDSLTEEIEDKKVKFDYALIEFIEGGDSTDTPSEARLRKLKEEKRKFTDLDELGDLIFRADEDVKEFGGPGYDKLYVDFYGKADDGTDVKIHIYRADLGDGMKREDHLSNSDVPQIEEYLEKEYNKNK